MSNIKKEIPIKNYIIFTIIICVSIFLIYYAYLWYQIYDQDKLNSPILDKELQVINANELENYIQENSSVIVYISILGDEEVRNFEKKFKTIIKKYSLKNEILYMDLTNDITNEAYTQANTPVILVYEDGELIDSYNIKKHDYNTKKIQKFLVKVGAIDND